MSESTLICPHPTCRKTITRTATTDAQPQQCPHCGQSLTLDPYQTVAPSPVEPGDPFQTAGPSPAGRPKRRSTYEPASAAENDAFQTAARPARAAPPSAMFIPPEDKPLQLGRFQTRKKLGAGAFGVVYRAHDPQLDREVALKVAKPQMLTSRESVKRFLREAKAAANLRHPNIVPVFDSGQDGEHYYIASAFIPGRTLAAAVAATKGKGLEPRQAAGIVRHLAEALAYAHKQGVVHRDVKPANVLLDEQGEPLLTDFGLATREQGQEKVTTDGTSLMGTPAYMAPEQAAGKAEAASDQYSIGCTLYELLTGRMPFEGGWESQLVQHKTQEPPSLRTHQHTLPRDLETICLKALAKKPSERYVDCQALADDLRRWLDGEPTMARPLGRRERAVRWVKRNPAVAALTLMVALTLLLGTAVSSVFAVRAAREQARTRQAERDRLLAQVEALLDVSPQAVSTILQELEPFRATVNPRLRQLRDQPNLSRRHRTRVSLALLPVDAGEVAYLHQRLLDVTVEPEEMLLIRKALEPYRDPLIADLRMLATNPHADPDQRFRAVVALAAFDSDNPRWAVAGDKVVGRFLGCNPLHLGTWTEALRPVRRSLLTPLGQVFRDRNQPEQRRVAATILVDYAADEPEVLAELLTEADPWQYALLWPQVQVHRQRAMVRLHQEVDKPMPAPDQLEARDALSRRQATAAVALLQLGQPEPVWHLLRDSSYPSRRSYLLHSLGRLGTPPDPLVKRLETETDVRARRSLILSLGEYTEAQLPAPRRQALVEPLLRWYRDDPDPGIHGAVDWLLRHGRQGPQPRQLDWGQAEALRATDRDLAGQLPGERRWYVNREVQTMTIVRGPVEVRMGSPDFEPDRYLDEVQVQKCIPRSFAIAAKCVTVAQFQRFLAANPKVQHSYEKRYSPEDRGPIITVSWFQAAQYCNWLSAREGIAKEQWCYPALDEIKEGMELPGDYLHRTGYRLPTEAEWEYACRAGALTSRCYGSSEELLGEYAWYLKNSNDRTWPPGQLKPNDLGLFDVHGNVWNWCHNRWAESQQQGDDIEDTDLVVHQAKERVLRGASFYSFAALVRAANRDTFRPSNRDVCTVGIRPARTLP